MLTRTFLILSEDNVIITLILNLPYEFQITVFFYHRIQSFMVKRLAILKTHSFTIWFIPSIEVRNKHMTNKYQDFLKEPYDEMITLISEWIKSGNRILDIGANNGNLEDVINQRFDGCIVYCIEGDKDVIRDLKSKNYNKIKVEVINECINEFLLKTDIANIDVILTNNTIHEINDVKNQASYLEGFFGAIRRILKKDGIVIMGDLYYPPYLKEADVESYRQYQKSKIDHADSREKFVSPILVEKKARENDFTVVYKKEIRAVREIDRRYYSFVLVKNK